MHAWVFVWWPIATAQRFSIMSQSWYIKTGRELWPPDTRVWRYNFSSRKRQAVYLKVIAFQLYSFQWRDPICDVICISWKSSSVYIAFLKLFNSALFLMVYGCSHFCFCPKVEQILVPIWPFIRTLKVVSPNFAIYISNMITFSSMNH
jgi:hypothetical protein